MKRFVALILTAAFLVLGIPAVAADSIVIDNLDDGIRYTGAWDHAKWSRSGCYAGSVSASGAEDAAAELTFTGVRAALYGMKGQNGGSCEIFIDGSSAGTVDLHADSLQVQSKLLETQPLTPGEHTLRLVKTGGSGMVFVDCIRVWTEEAGGVSQSANNLLRYADVTNARADEAAVMLSSLGMMDDLGGGLFGASYGLTYAELEQLSEPLGAPGVPEADPNARVSEQEAAFVVLDLLGYGDKARQERSGGYVQVANRLGLKGISGAEYITREKAAQLFYSALTIGCAAATYTTDGVSYEQGDSTLLKDKLKLNSIGGRMTANRYTALSTPNRYAGHNRVEIGGVVYHTTDAYAHSLIGCNVVGFADEDGRLAAVYAPDNRNDRVHINAPDILSATENTVTYQEGEEEEEISFDGTIDVIYNEKALSRVLTADDLTPDAGGLTFIDADQNGRYDVLLIDSPELGIVESVSEIGKAIRLQYGEPQVSLADADTVIVRNGEPAELSALVADDVIAMVRIPLPDGGVTIQIDAVSDKASGMVAEVEMPDRITVAGKTYEVAKKYRDRVMGSAKAGEEVTLLLTKEGRVLGCSRGGETKRMGILVAYSTPLGLDARPELKLFDTAGDTVIHRLARQVKINGGKAQSGELSAVEGVLAAAQYQLIQFGVNGSGEISQINTAVLIPNPTEADQDTFRMKYTTLTPRRYYGYTGMHFENQLYINSGCTVIAVPSDSDRGNTEKYKILNVSSLTHNIDYNINVYNETDYGTADIILIQTAAADEPQKDMYQFDRLAQGLDEEGQDVYQLYASGASGSVVLSGETLTQAVSELNRGDIFRIVSSKTGWFDDVKKVYDRRTGEIQPGFTMESGEVWYSGVVKKYKNNMLQIQDATGRMLFFRIDAGSQRSYYEPGTDRMLTIKAADITPGMQVFIVEKDSISIRNLFLFGAEGE